MSPELIIDGYNLLHYAGLGALCRRPGRFEQARDQLLLRLKRSLTEKELARTLVVFDAQYAENVDRRPIVIHGMTVVFSPRGRQADDLIEDLLCATAQPRLLRVVSSDHRLLRAARAVGPGFIDSDSFLVELDERQTQKKRQADHDSQTTSPSRVRTQVELTTEDWLKEFGEIDPKEIEKSLREEFRQRPTPAPPEQRSPPGKKQPTQPTPAQPPATQLGSQPPTPSIQQPSQLPTKPQTSTALNRKAPPLRRKILPPDVSSDVENEQTVLDDELAFWEQRIADLSLEEPSSHPAGKRTTPPKKPPGK